MSDAVSSAANLSASAISSMVLALKNGSSGETPHEIARQEWAIRRGAQHLFDLGPVGSGPIEAGQNARKRPWKIGDAVGDHRQSERSEARGIAIGIEDEPVALRLQPRDHALSVPLEA
jgi:hypothetical protein